jgi:hypothetical protein
MVARPLKFSTRSNHLITRHPPDSACVLGVTAAAAQPVVFAWPGGVARPAALRAPGGAGRPAALRAPSGAGRPAQVHPGWRSPGPARGPPPAAGARMMAYTRLGPSPNGRRAPMASARSRCAVPGRRVRRWARSGGWRATSGDPCAVRMMVTGGPDDDRWAGRAVIGRPVDDGR